MFEPPEIDEKSSSESASCTSRFWSSVVEHLARDLLRRHHRQVGDLTADVVERAFARRLDVALGFARGFGENLLPALFGLVLVRVGRLARALHDLFGLCARLLQTLAVFVQQLVGLLARALGRIDRFFDAPLAPFQRLRDAREGQA